MSPNQVLEPRKSVHDFNDKSKTPKNHQSKSSQNTFVPKHSANVYNMENNINKINEEEEYQPGFLDGEVENYEIKVKDSIPVSLHNINLSMKSVSHHDNNKTENKVIFFK